MDAAGHLAQTIGSGIVGLISGALQALAGAFLGITHALATALPWPWLPVLGVVGLVLLVMSVVRR